MTSTPQFPSFGLQRRHLLGGALAASVVQLEPADLGSHGTGHCRKQQLYGAVALPDCPQ